MFLLPSYAQTRPSIYEEPFVPFRGRFSVPESDARKGYRRRLAEDGLSNNTENRPRRCKRKGKQNKKRARVFAQARANVYGYQRRTYPAGAAALLR